MQPKNLRTGFTTGACAAAAARAAVLGLGEGRIPEGVTCLLPNGEQFHFPIAHSAIHGHHARAVVIKDAGSDPDCTHGAHLTAEARLLPGLPGQVRIEGGDGVGTVTLPGLGLEVGGPAINPVPRRNIEENARLAAGALLAEHGVAITISAPGGQQMAKRTINARLGILGGISILGTTGIVHPWSTAAFRATVVQGIRVAAAQGQAQGQDTVVLTTGGRTERFAMGMLPHLAPVCFVQMGDFLRYALDTAAEQGIPHVIIAAMVGKLAKMAQGETITHANRNPVNMDLVAEIAAEAGASAAVCHDIRQAKTARYAGERLTGLGLSDAFHDALARRVVETLTGRYPGKFTLRVLVCDFEGRFLVDSG